MGQITFEYFFERQLIPYASKVDFSQLNNPHQLER